MRFVLCVLFLAVAGPLYAAEPTNNEKILAAIERMEKQQAAVLSRLDALEARVAGAERFATKAGYKPAQAAPAVAAGVPPTITATIVQPVAGPNTSYPAGTQTVRTVTSASVTVQSGGTEYRRGPLGLLAWRVGSRSGARTATYTTAQQCASGK